jgi:hypothetical protein
VILYDLYVAVVARMGPGRLINLQIPLAGDFRPYVTIHDRDYTSLINKSPPKVGVVIGVTNPFILSVTKHWPNVLSLNWEDGGTYVYLHSKNVASSHLFSDNLTKSAVGHLATCLEVGLSLGSKRRHTKDTHPKTGFSSSLGKRHWKKEVT